MPAEQADGFADNWAYLRTELHWLDRLLVTAVAKQRKETKDIDRIAQSKADRASSHWWKGVIVPDGKVSYDEYRQPSQGIAPKLSYQHQIEARIQAARQRGVVLALPSLCDRLALNLFEKNVVLMSLAPEVNRRYARLYRYLQGEESTIQTDLPTLDLVLRLLCKNDSEWRSSRNHLVNDSALTCTGLLDFLPADDTLLNCPLKLTTPLVNYLLADHPTPQALETLLSPAEIGIMREAARTELPPPVSLQIAPLPAQTTSFLQYPLAETKLETEPETNWSKLVLPAATLEALQSLAQRVHGSRKAIDLWKLPPDQSPPLGLMALLAGAAGTGKTTAAAALAAALQTALTQVDLAALEPADSLKVLEEIAASAPGVLLIQSAQLWLKRSTPLPLPVFQQFWQQRRCVSGITLFSVTQQAAVQVRWQQQMDQIVRFSLPDQQQRLCLWQQAFPAEIPLDTIDWQALAALSLHPGEIQSIVYEAITYAALEKVPKVNHAHILKTLSRRGKKLASLPAVRTKKT